MSQLDLAGQGTMGSTRNAISYQDHEHKVFLALSMKVLFARESGDVSDYRRKVCWAVQLDRGVGYGALVCLDNPGNAVAALIERPSQREAMTGGSMHQSAVAECWKLLVGVVVLEDATNRLHRSDVLVWRMWVHV